MKKRLTGSLLAAFALSFSLASTAEPKRPECIAPAKPGGGFDLTCKLAQSGLSDNKLLTKPMRVTFMPGGVGAVAYNSMVGQRSKDGNAIVAFSTGSLLNLAQGKFGRYSEKDVRWLTTVGADYGVIAVSADSKLKTLNDLVEALQKDPKKVVFGAGATIGGQDWMQVALLSRTINVDPRNLRYVAFEGGGETLTAMLGGHIDVSSGGLGEFVPHVESGKIRILAVLAEKRVEGSMSHIPTAIEQGYDVTWPVIRGFYMAPNVSDADFNWWQQQFDTMLKLDAYQTLREQRGLFPLQLTGAELEKVVYKQVEDFRSLAKEFDLVK